MERKSPTQQYWFRSKRYGFGWTPCAWQGWAVVGVWAVAFTLLVIGMTAAAHASNTGAFIALLALSVASTFALAWISWRHGEPPRWRWGR